MSDTYFEISYFRCRSNPKGPLLMLGTKWEADEMKTNHAYDRVDEDGLPIVSEPELLAQG